MAEITPAHTTNAINMLSEGALKRKHVEEYDSDPVREEFDEEIHSTSPVYDSYFDNNPQSVLEMTNFTPPEFEKTWCDIRDHATSNWGKGKGRRSSFGAKDVFFMTLTVLKQGGQWDFLGKLFLIKGPTFEKLIMRFIRIISEHVYVKFAVNLADYYPMHKVLESQTSSFRHFKFAKYATDVTFQQTNRPAGNIDEAKRYFSGKHKLYGYKVEVSVLPFGFAICCSTHYPGSVSDLEILRKMKDYHEIMLEKKSKDIGITDIGHLCDEFPDHWALLVDKGYIGAAQTLHAIHPKRKPARVVLTLAEEGENKKVSSDRVIAENCFGRFCSLWSVMAFKYRWAEESYDDIFQLCIGLTNRHVRRNPLRADDAQFYKKLKNRQYTIGE